MERERPTKLTRPPQVEGSDNKGWENMPHSEYSVSGLIGLNEAFMEISVYLSRMLLHTLPCQILYRYCRHVTEAREVYIDKVHCVYTWKLP